MTRVVRSMVLAISLLLVTAACTAAPATSGLHDPAGYDGGSSVPEPYEMPDLTLTDTSDQPYNLLSSPSKPVTLLFFGYSHCPDICTTVMADVALALQRMDGARRDQIEVVFVTTDPGRDTPEVLRRYLDRFNPGFVGLTGSLATIKDAAGRVGVDIEGMKKLPSGGYEVGHTAQLIGFDRAEGVVLWTPGTSVGDLIHDFGHLVEQSR